MRPALLRAGIEASDRSLARAVFLLLLAVYTATFGGAPAGPDGEVVFQTTSALWRHGSLALQGTPEARGLIEEAQRAGPGGFSVRRGEGQRADRHYGWYGVGQAALALPFYAAGKLAAVVWPRVQAAHEGHERYGVARSEYFEHLFFGWRNACWTALVGLLLVLSARRLQLGRGPALLCGLGYGLATFAWPQARDVLGDVQGSLALVASLYLLLLLQERATTWRALGFGLSLGLAFLTRAVLAPAVLVFDAGAWWFLHRVKATPLAGPEGIRARRLWILVALPQVAALLLWLGLNQVRFGSPFDSGYGQAVAGGLFAGSPLWALVGVTLSPSKGLLWMAPGLLLMGLGWQRLRHDRQGGLLVLLACASAAVLMPVLFLRGWHGAYTYGPRYLLPALPLLWLLAAFGFQRTRLDRRLHPLALGLVGVGLVTQLPGALVDTLTYHDLAVRAAAERFEPRGAGSVRDHQAQAFEDMQFDWGFAAPWAHWRILRHRVALEHDDFGAQDLFLFESELQLVPAQPRERGFRHLAWVDLHQRLGGRTWPAVALILLLGVLGAIEAARGLDS